MTFIGRKFFLASSVLFALMLACVSPSLAADDDANRYKESGTVSAFTTKGGYVYRVVTDTRIYQLLCANSQIFNFGPPACKQDGKPIAAGDVLHFRLDQDWAYAAGKPRDSEQKFRVISTELKEIPKIPSPATLPTDQNAKVSKELGVAVGTGMHVKGSQGASWARPASGGGPVTAAPGSTGPITGVPVTGGPPVTVVAVSPGPGPVTGVPVTGGPPVTVVPMGGAPTGAPAGGGMVMHPGGGAPVWFHLLRIQTDTHVYEVECTNKPCVLWDKQIKLGDSVTLRTDKKWIYLIPDPSDPRPEVRYKILGIELIQPAKEEKSTN